MGYRPLAHAPSHVRFFTYAYAVLVGLVPAPILLGPAFMGGALGVLLGIVGLTGVAGSVVGMLAILRRNQDQGAARIAKLLTGILLLLFLPAWGLLVDAAADSCDGPKCDPSFRPLALPEAFGLLPLHLLSAGAFFLSWRRPEALSPRGEAALATALLGGVVLQGMLALQFVPAIPYAIFILPLPILSPYASLPLLLHTLERRLRDRGHEALVVKAEAEAAAQVPAEVGYREPAERVVAARMETRRPIALGIAARGLLGLPALLGLHAVVNAALFQSRTGGVDAFLRTCSYPLSTLGVPVPKDCHYLCTIAAQGSPALVKPYRWGVRRGQPIVVNRQLALANAFEDLLHERWPRFGRLARRTYDALAYPVSTALSRRWLANAIYVAMKPAEVVFALALLFLDPGDPEARIDRMYR